MQAKLFDALASRIAQRNRFHAPTSAWNVGQQIEHCCLVIDSVQRALATSTPPAPRARVSLARRFVFLTGRIPRGRAQAPRSVRPQPVPEPADLEERVQGARVQVDTIRGLAPDRWFRHFAFDVLRRDEALRFLEIHTNHHLRIIRRIARRA